MSDSILSLEHLGVRLPKGADRPHALSDVSLSIEPDEILCVVGESGSGKSMMANAIMRLLPNEVTIDGGRVMFEGKDLASASVAEMRRVRGAGIAMIFQEPMTALNPLRTIGDQIGEMFSIHTELSKAEIADKVLAALGGSQIVHGHSVIADQLGVHPSEVEGPCLYADGKALGVDGGVFVGGPCLVVRLSPAEADPESFAEVATEPAEDATGDTDVVAEQDADEPD